MDKKQSRLKKLILLILSIGLLAHYYGIEEVFFFSLTTSICLIVLYRSRMGKMSPEMQAKAGIIRLTKKQDKVREVCLLIALLAFFASQNGLISISLRKLVIFGSLAFLALFVLLTKKRQTKGTAAHRGVSIKRVLRHLLLLVASAYIVFVYLESKGDMDIHTAAGMGKVERVSSLLASGIDPNERKNAQTPLLAAVKSTADGTDKVVSLLLEAGADVNSQDREGLTPLHTAIRSNQPVEVVSFLIERGADMHSPNNHIPTPLVFQCKEYRSKIGELVKSDEKAAAEFERRVLARLSILLEKGSRLANELGRRECLRILGKGQPNTRKIVSLLDAGGGDL